MTHLTASLCAQVQLCPPEAHHLRLLARMQERRFEGARLSRMARLKAEIADRLRHVCEGWSDEEFDRLISRIAEIDIKYRMRSRRDIFDVE